MVKRVGCCVYAHKTNRFELLRNIKDIDERDKVDQVLVGIDGFYDWDICKYDKHNHKVSLIKCPTFFERNEPIVGDSLIFDISKGNCLAEYSSKTAKARKNNPQIYHHRHLFVSDDYNDDFIAKSKERMELINSYNPDKKRMGNMNYWKWFLLDNGMEE